jgi:hypothetical protein
MEILFIYGAMYQHNGFFPNTIYNWSIIAGAGPPPPPPSQIGRIIQSNIGIHNSLGIF